MAGQTKMIIITSNEDIIRQFSLNKDKYTRIIDLDGDKPKTPSEIDDSNMVSMALLAELSKLDSKNDQVYKRALDSPQHDPSEPVKMRKTSVDMVCVICGDHAIGFNYDVLSCASCKAFFRRNANQNADKIRCLTGRGQCSIAHGARRRCPKCRIEHCFAAGMRKDFILSEEEKQRRKIRREESQNITSQRLSTSESTNSSSITQSVSNTESLSPTIDEMDNLLMDLDKVDGNIVFQEGTESNGIEEMLFGTLSIEDWIAIQNVQSSFRSVFDNPTNAWVDRLDVSDHASALISWSELVNEILLRYINFFRQINEFQDLHIDDRLILIKYNLMTVFPLSKCYTYNHPDDCCSNGSAAAVEKHRRFFMLCDAPDTTCDGFTDSVVSLVQITEKNPILLSLLLIILMLTPGLSMNEEEPPLNDSLAVNRAQCHFTTILWNYLVNQSGELQACRRFTQLLHVILRMQLTTRNFRIFFRDQYVRSNAVDKIAPLMQSVLQIS